MVHGITHDSSFHFFGAVVGAGAAAIDDDAAAVVVVVVVVDAAPVDVAVVVGAGDPILRNTRLGDGFGAVNAC